MQKTVRDFIKALMVVWLLTFICLFSLEAKQPDLPNIIIFLVDDMGLMDTSVPMLTDDSGQPVLHPLLSFLCSACLLSFPRFDPDWTKRYAT